MMTKLFLSILTVSCILSHIIFATQLNDTFHKRQQKLLNFVNARMDIPSDFRPFPWSTQHSYSDTAIFLVAFGMIWRPNKVKQFFGTARKVGIVDDIVIGVDQNAPLNFLESLHSYQAIIYNLNVICDSKVYTTRRCHLDKMNHLPVSINMMRFLVYKWWTYLYPLNTMIMISDFRDVFFQSNPFTYSIDQWKSPSFDLIFFLEPIPQKMIYRCPFNSGWIATCYGDDALLEVKNNPVSCSGVSFGSRDAMLAYTYLMFQQLDDEFRAKVKKGEVPSMKQCYSLGMDQGFHNYLLHSGLLQRYFKIKVFHQGEGLVNTLGVFPVRDKSLLKFDIERDWKIIRGKEGEKVIVNWDGTPSPVVHQAERFMKYSVPEIGKHLQIMKGISFNYSEETSFAPV